MNNVNPIYLTESLPRYLKNLKKKYGNGENAAQHIEATSFEDDDRRKMMRNKLAFHDAGKRIARQSWVVDGNGQKKQLPKVANKWHPPEYSSKAHEERDNAIWDAQYNKHWAKKRLTDPELRGPMERPGRENASDDLINARVKKDPYSSTTNKQRLQNYRDKIYIPKKRKQLARARASVNPHLP